MNYAGGEEARVGDVWSDYPPESNNHDSRQWTTTGIDGEYLSYDCLFVTVSSRTYGTSGLYLVRRGGPVVRKKTGFGKFMTYIEKANHETP